MILGFWLLLAVTHSAPSLYSTFPTYYKQYGIFQQPNLFNIKRQFRTQDEFGQYSYGYDYDSSSKIESRAVDGFTQGSYAYIDSNGIIRNVNYVADDANGFRVSSLNIPGESMHEEGSTNAEILSEVNDVKREEPTVMLEGDSNTPEIPVEQNSTKKFTEQLTIPAYVDNSFIQYPTRQNEYLSAMYIGSLGTQNVPQISSIYSQFHSQDEQGQYSYGYSGGLSSKIETKTSDDITRGEYSYVDANGILQRVSYISDPINGFRVQTTSFPVSGIAQTLYYPSEYQSPQLSLTANQKIDKFN